MQDGGMSYRKITAEDEKRVIQRLSDTMDTDLDYSKIITDDSEKTPENIVHGEPKPYPKVFIRHNIS